jgi:sensor histidine kinase YesM
MMKMRYGDNLRFDHHIDHDKYDNYHVLPLSIQGLIENAIKHNVVTQRHPMTITIECEGDRLRVRNPRQPKTDSGPHSGIGLDNLSQRCRLLTGRDIKVTSSDKYFEVDMPLGNYRE